MGEWLADDLIRNTGLPESKVHCVGGGCNLCSDKIDVSLKKGNKFLFVGKDFERKNGKLVVEAFKRLNHKYKGKFELYIAGPTEWPLLEEKSEKIFFLGLKNTEELVKYYNLCDVFVMPSKFEAYGLVFAEALSYGLPCIGANSFAMCEFIEHGKNGYLLNKNSAEELFRLMELAINNEQMIKYVQEESKKYIDLYSWDTVVRKMLTVMKNDGYDVGI